MEFSEFNKFNKFSEFSKLNESYKLLNLLNLLNSKLIKLIKLQTACGITAGLLARSLSLPPSRLIHVGVKQWPQWQ